MASQTSSAAETSSNNLHHTIQVDSVQVEHSSQLLFVEMLLDRDWKNVEFLKLLDNYFNDCHKIINFDAAVVQEYLNSYQSLIQDTEGSSSGVNWEAPLNISHNQFFDDLDGVYRQQMLMQDKLRSFQNDLSRKLHRAQLWKRLFAVTFFTATVVLTTVAYHAISRKKIAAAMASVLPILLGTIWRGKIWDCTVSLLNQHMDDVKKYVEITGLMAFGATITINGLSSLHSSASRFETQTKSMSDAGEERKKLVESFQELQGKAANFCRDICSARECTLESVKKHLDSMTRLSY